MRIDYADAAVRAAVYELLDMSFARLSDRIRIAERLDAVWHDVSTAFVANDNDVPVAHAGVIAIPLVIAGERRDVAGVHAVCTHPGFRGRGHIRAVLDEALAYVDTKFDAAVLTTSIPALYERFGFRVVPEFVAHYHGPLPARTRPARQLDASSGADVELLHRLARQRQPVSHSLSSIDSGWLLIINEVLASWGLSRVYYTEDLDVAFVAECEHGTLKLLDVVGPHIPDVATLLAAMPMEFDRVEIHFVPDRLGSGPYEYEASDPEDCLMVRGSLELPSSVMLPQLARC